VSKAVFVLLLLLFSGFVFAEKIGVDSDLVSSVESGLPEELNNYHAVSYEIKPKTSIGEIVKNITNKTVEEIKQEIQQSNFSGERISEIAKKIGVEVKAVVLTKVEELKEKVLKKLQKKDLIKYRFKQAELYKYEYAFEKRTKYMDKVIELAMDQGVNTSELEQLKSEFEEKYLELQNASDKHEVLQELKAILQEFREKAQELIPDFDEEQVLAEVENETGSMRETVWAHLKEVALKVFDKRVEMANKTVNVLEERGYNVSELRAKLDEIIGLRDDLSAAYDSMNRSEVLAVHKEITSKFIEFRKLHGSLISEAAREKVLDKAEKVLARIKQRAEECGIVYDFSDLEEALQKAKETKDLSVFREVFSEEKQDLINILKCVSPEGESA